jgi:hypothetical protein
MVAPSGLAATAVMICLPAGLMSTSPGSLSCLEALRPPVEQCRRADALRLALKRGTVG